MATVLVTALSLTFSHRRALIRSSRQWVTWCASRVPLSPPLPVSTRRCPARSSTLGQRHFSHWGISSTTTATCPTSGPRTRPRTAASRPPPDPPQAMRTTRRPAPRATTPTSAPWRGARLRATARSISVTGSQVQWLKSDLAANTKRCVLAYMHKPRWGNTDRSEFQPIYSALVSGGVTLLLSGHEHNYQAQPKRAASGAESATGVAQYVVGTGGKSVWKNSFTADQKPLAFNSSTFGWLKVTLHSTSADLKFVPVGGSFTDSRTVVCNP